MTENKKLAFVVTSMGRGGAERVVSILSNYYANIGWDVTIIMLWHNKVGYALDEKIKILNSIFRIFYIYILIYSKR